jgi:two-component sensor histidine kinase
VTRIAVIRAAISADRSVASSLWIVLAALIVATLIRGALAGAVPHLTFVTYYPAVLICCLMTGWRYGLACAGLSGVVAEVLFPSPTAMSLFGPASFASLILFMTSCAIIIATADALRRAVRDLDDLNRLAETLNKELQHRVANMLAVVQALASQSAKGANPETFVTAFGGRLRALAKAHELLGRRNLETCTLPELVDEACKAFCHDENVATSGPACQLPSASCVPLVLAMHELCTNAVKYGALSTPQGKVDISWRFSELPQRIMIEWKETGGPVVSKPSRKGLGSTLLRRQPGIAEAELSFEASGVRCRLCIDGAKPLEMSMERKRALA